MKKKGILIMSAILILVIVVYLKSCAYLPVKGTIIDAETNQPIKGAIIVSEWVLRSWFPHGERIYKTVETISNKDGQFRINIFLVNPFIVSRLDNPNITIYKAGYVCWNSYYIFPDNKHREDFKWGNNRKYILERFKKEYSYTEHSSFIESTVHTWLDSRDSFRQAYEWEIEMRQKELGGHR